MVCFCSLRSIATLFPSENSLSNHVSMWYWRHHVHPCDLCFTAIPAKKTHQGQRKQPRQKQNVCLMSCLLSPTFFLNFGTQWFSLRDVPSGSIHLRLEWLSLLSSADRLSEVRLILLSTQEFDDVHFLCSLVIFLHMYC